MNKRRESEESRLARTAALWVLFGIDVSKTLAKELLYQSYDTLVERDERLPQVWDRVEQRVLGVSGQLEMLHDEIQVLSPRWRLDRMAVIDRNILRLGVWELLTLREERPSLVISACVELGKIYGEKTSGAFINGMLDQLCKNHQIVTSATPSAPRQG